MAQLGLSQAIDKRHRVLSIDPLRLVWLGMTALCLSLGATLGATYWKEQQRANKTAGAALNYVDAQLDMLDELLSRVARHPTLQQPIDGCPPALVSMLLDETLASLLVRRVVVGSADGSVRCGPGGSTPPINVPITPTATLALVSQPTIDRQMLALRATPGGLTVLATLDPRTFAPAATAGAGADADVDADAVKSWAASERLRITLLSADARPLAMLRASATLGAQAQRQAAPSDAPWREIGALRASSRHHVFVAVTADPDQLAGLLWQRAVLTLLITLMALAVAAAWIWRRALMRARLFNRLEIALRKRQFEPFVQPIVDVATGQCVGGEVLMRWLHPQRGVLGPGEFIEEAERSGLIVGMSDLVMARAAHRLAPLAAAHPQLYFSFNITPEQLRGADFVHHLGEIFRPDTLPREQVLLELTEREFVDPAASRMLLALRGAGWRIAIDDFGTGQSSLSTIEQLPIDRIKIDRAFVSAIDGNTVSRPVLDVIIKLAQELQVGLIAEGVETQSQWDYLAARHVGCAQGFLFARPMPIDAYVRWVSEQAVPVAGGAVTPRAVATAGEEAQAPLHELCQRLASTGGLDIRDRVYRLHRYERCFVGREAVDWVTRHLTVSRSAALRIGRQLMALGLMRHVLDEHDFEDADLYYRLIPGDAASAQPVVPAAADLAQALSSVHGLPWLDQVRGLLRHRRCNSGRSIVSWLSARYEVPRATATQWAVQLMRQGRLRHVFDDQPFRDDATLYRAG